MAGLGHLAAVVVLAVVAGLHARSNTWIQQRGEEAVALTSPLAHKLTLGTYLAVERNPNLSLPSYFLLLSAWDPTHRPRRVTSPRAFMRKLRHEEKTWWMLAVPCGAGRGHVPPVVFRRPEEWPARMVIEEHRACPSVVTMTAGGGCRHASRRCYGRKQVAQDDGRCSRRRGGVQRQWVQPEARSHMHDGLERHV